MSINSTNNIIAQQQKIEHINWQTGKNPSFSETKIDKYYDERYLEIARHFRELARLFENLAEVKKS